MQEDKDIDQELNKKLNLVMEKYLKRLMVGSLDIIEQYYNRDTEEFQIIRKKILRLGNDQIRDIAEYLGISYTYKMEFKERKGE